MLGWVELLGFDNTWMMIHTDTAHTDTETYIVIGKRPIPIPGYNLYQYQYQADDHTDTHSQTTHDDNEYALKRGKVLTWRG